MTGAISVGFFYEMPRVIELDAGADTFLSFMFSRFQIKAGAAKAP